jgi:proteasome lid subunit RPN8/RPN11
MEIQKNLPPIVKSPTSFKMFIPAKVENKIRILLNNIYNIEWSGVLFYTYTGSFENNDLVITCEDIYPMNIGNSVYTEFENTPDIAGYIVDNQLFDCCHGLVHSHHNMNTFFSGTDISTLQSEGNDTVHFVSLIVNNAGEYNAAITRKVKATFEGDMIEEFKSYDGEVINKTTKTVQQREMIMYNPLIVEIEKSNYTTDLYNRIKELKDKNAKTKTSVATSSMANTSITWPFQSKIEFPKDEDEKFDTINVVEDEIKLCLSKLLTGNVNTDILSKEEMYKLSNNMNERFGKTFGTMKAFSYWADAYIDCMLNTVNGGWPDDEYVSSLSEELIYRLQELGDDPYIKEYINSLCNYVIPETTK